MKREKGGFRTHTKTEKKEKHRRGRLAAEIGEAKEEKRQNMCNLGGELLSLGDS